MVINRLSIILGEKRLKVSQVHRGTGIDSKTLLNLYHDNTTGIKFQTLNKLCEYLNIQPGDLLVFVPDKE